MHRVSQDDDGLTRRSLSTNRTTFWGVRDPQAIAWREWDDEIVVYSENTGSTHHLGPVGSAVLSALFRHPAPVEISSLVATVAQAIEVPSDTALQPEIERALVELAELRLASCHPD